MKRKIAVIIISFVFIMFLGQTKAEAKIILPPQDIISTPYCSTLGGSGIYQKTEYTFDCAGGRTGGYNFYRMPYKMEAREGIYSVPFYYNPGDICTITIEEQIGKTYNLTKGFSTTYSETCESTLDFSVGNDIFEVGSGFTHTFGSEIENHVENSTSTSHTFSTSITREFVVQEAGVYALAYIKRCNIFIVQEFKILSENGCPYHAETGRYDVVFTEDTSFIPYMDVVNLSLTTTPTITDGVLQVNNSISLVELLNL